MHDMACVINRMDRQHVLAQDPIAQENKSVRCAPCCGEFVTTCTIPALREITTENKG